MAELTDFVRQEWREKLLYKFQNRIRPPPPPPKEGEEEEEKPEEEEQVFGPDEEIPKVPYRKLAPTASEYVIAVENSIYQKNRANLMKTIPDDVIDLRKYTIVGGTYSLQLLHQPPQPQEFVTMEMSLTPRDLYMN